MTSTAPDQDSSTTSSEAVNGESERVLLHHFSLLPTGTHTRLVSGRSDGPGANSRFRFEVFGSIRFDFFLAPDKLPKNRHFAASTCMKFRTEAVEIGDIRRKKATADKSKSTSIAVGCGSECAHDKDSILRQQ